MTRPEINVPESILQLLLGVLKAAEKVRVDFFLIGATARDLIFSQYGISPGRATRDVDFGIRVSSWDAFSNLKTELLNLE